jgi:cell division protein FtsA
MARRSAKEEAAVNRDFNSSGERTMKPDFVAVLDLGSTKTTCLVASADEHQEACVEAVAIVEGRGVRRGVVNDLEAASSVADAAIRACEEQLGSPIERVTVGISGASVEGLTAQGFVPIYPRSRSITREDVLQVINHSRQIMLPPDREMIHALPREFRVDGQRGVQRPVGMSGGKLEVSTYVVTGPSPQIQNLDQTVSNGGRKVDQYILSGMASGLGVLSMEDMDAGTVVVDIGGGKTDIAIFAGGALTYSACLPIAGGLVTSDISKLLRTSPEEAERLKCSYGAAVAGLVGDQDAVEVHQIGQSEPRPLQRKVLCEIIESRMRELAMMVRQQVEKSGSLGLLPGGIVLTGGGSALAASDKLFEEVLKHSRVRTMEPILGNGNAVPEARMGLSAAMGMARFALQGGDEEFAPASGGDGIRDRIRTIWSILSGRS